MEYLLVVTSLDQKAPRYNQINCQDTIRRSIDNDNVIAVDHLQGINRGKSGTACRLHWIELPNQSHQLPAADLSVVCRAPRPATSSTGSPASHPFLLPGPAKQCRRKQPTTRSRLRPLASDDASDSRATPVAYASPGMRWVCRLCKSRADGCLMCQMRWTAAEVLVMSIASIGMPI
jgi:hypothetical protein